MPTIYSKSISTHAKLPFQIRESRKISMAIRKSDTFAGRLAIGRASIHSLRVAPTRTQWDIRSDVSNTNQRYAESRLSFNEAGRLIRFFFVSERQRKKYFKSIARALIDFIELNPTSPIHLLVESLNSKKTLPLETLPVTLRNMGEYLHCVPLDAGISSVTWSPVIQGIEALFRRLVLILGNLDEPDYLLNIMVAVLKVPCIPKVIIRRSQYRYTSSQFHFNWQAILDPFCKVLSHCVQHATLTYKVLNDICCLSSRAFSKERDKHQLCRQMMFELVQALKFKSNIPDNNLLLMVAFLLEDAGGTLPAGIVPNLPETPPVYTTNATDCMRQYLNDVLDFLADFHTLSKIKNFKNGTDLNEDTLGGVLKGAIAQYLALEMSRGNSRDNKAVARYLPWLYNAPSSIQQGPKEFSECIGHMRLLSWLLIGALTHTGLMTRKGGSIGQHGASVHYHLQHPGHTVAQPVPQEASCHIADHIQVIFAGFVEQSKTSTSVLHMSSLFHAFTLCQLWSIYLEQISYLTAPSSEPHNITMGILFEFWGKVTPSILHLVSSSKVVSISSPFIPFENRKIITNCRYVDVRNGESTFYQFAGSPQRDPMHHTHQIVAAMESSVVVTFAAIKHIAATFENRSRSGAVHRKPRRPPIGGTSQILAKTSIQNGTNRAAIVNRYPILFNLIRAASRQRNACHNT